MTEPDKTIVDPVTTLMAYGVPEWRVRFCKEILAKAQTTQELERELGIRHASIDWSQALMPAFSPLYQNKPDIRRCVQEALVVANLPSAIVDEYFTQLGNQPYLAFNLKYEDDIPAQTRDQFNELASQVVIDTIVRYYPAKCCATTGTCSIYLSP